MAPRPRSRRQINWLQLETDSWPLCTISLLLALWEGWRKNVFQHLLNSFDDFAEAKVLGPGLVLCTAINKERTYWLRNRQKSSIKVKSIYCKCPNEHSYPHDTYDKLLMHTHFLQNLHHVVQMTFIARQWNEFSTAFQTSSKIMIVKWTALNQTHHEVCVRANDDRMTDYHLGLRRGVGHND